MLVEQALCNYSANICRVVTFLFIDTVQ